jgi:SRSO17 transposase
MLGLAHVVRWATDLETLHRRIAGRFARSEQRRRSLAYLKALLSPVERKNGWQLAEQIGERRPDGVQRLLNAADWDAEAVRDDLRSYVVEHLGDEEAVLIVDETGFVKKGDKSVGVQRQYCGTAGRIENCQVGVFLCYASRHGSAFLDRALYLPKDWALNPVRRQEAGVPSSVRFLTKPELARAMLERALAAGVPFRWVTGDSVYGSDRRLRFFLEQRARWFVLAVPANELLMHAGPHYRRADALAAAVPAAQQWQRLSAGEGAKGPRVYDWVLVELWRLQLTEQERQWGHYLLARRSVEKPEEVAYYVVFCPRAQAVLETLVRVAGSRWQIEVGFEAAKGACGLDEYEVRKWDAWHRHVTLSLLAHAFLAAMRAREGPEGKPEGNEGQEEKGAAPSLLVA